MKRLTTYYFLLLLGLNMIFAQYLRFAVSEFKNGLQNMLEGKPLPLATERLIQFYWWPWMCVVIYGLGLMASLIGKPNDSILRNVLICILIIELLGMFVTAASFNLPWVLITWKLGS